jgi:hypothetical protein
MMWGLILGASCVVLVVLFCAALLLAMGEDL